MHKSGYGMPAKDMPKEKKEKGHNKDKSKMMSESSMKKMMNGK